jgi:hypothetical protein
MKIKRFEIPVEHMIEFAELLVDNELTNEIVDTDDSEIVVEVQYEPDERDAVFNLTEWYENLIPEEV